MKRRMILLSLAALPFFPQTALANSNVLSAEQAFAGVQEGSLILVDVRTPKEWDETGVAPGAWPMNVRDPEFREAFMSVLERNPNHQVAVICRTGKRSSTLVNMLEDNGVHGVLNVIEGMQGGPNGRGWIPTGLPVVSIDEAQSAMPVDLSVAE